MPLTRPFRRTAIAATAASVLALAGFALYGNGDWAVAADAGINPITAWNACLATGKPPALGNAQPGITPGSRLSYRPLITTQPSGERTLTGWEFFGHATDNDTRIPFTCTTDTTAVDIQAQFRAPAD